MRRRPNSWLLFFSLAFQIGAVMYAAVQFGQYLDLKTKTTKPWWTLGLCVFGLVAIIKLIYNQTKSL
ncbi:MAG: AtpZ/AtpI family protein [Flavobacteriaceae bacterium]